MDPAAASTRPTHPSGVGPSQVGSPRVGSARLGPSHAGSARPGTLTDSVRVLGLTAVALTWIMRLWRADLSVPFWSSGGALAAAGYVKNILTTGWYADQPDLGVPYGQHYEYASSPGDLNALVIKALGLFTSDWAVAFNLFFLLGFALAALSARWFFAECGLSRPLTVVLAVLFALAPYHFLRNETQIFSSSYWCLPLAMTLALRTVRGQPLWASRAGAGRLRGLTGGGAGPLAILVAVAYSGGDYALFTALLLAAGAVVGLVRRGRVRRVLGAVTALTVLGAASLAAALPALLRAHSLGALTPASAAPGSEAYAMKFASLVLPSPGEPLAALASIRARYDAQYPLPGESPALGAVATAGFLVVLLVCILRLTGRPRAAEPPADRARLGQALDEVAVLALATFCLGVLGGLGTVISYFAGGFSDWGRISIVLGLFGLAAAGLSVQMLASHLSQRQAAHLTRVGDGRRGPGRGAAGRTLGHLSAPGPWLIGLVLLLGVADQSLTGAVPAYRSNAAAAASDRQFVQGIEAIEPAGSAVFQMPWQPFSNSGAADDPAPGGQLALWLYAGTLRFSAGGIAGRPETDWPTRVVRSAPPTIVHDLAAVGFTGITIDLSMPGGGGPAWEQKMVPLLGAPLLRSADGRYVYLTMAPAIARLRAGTTAAQRAEIAAAVTGVTPQAAP